MILKEGELFHERYRIISQLGEGSIGTVYRALQIDSEREVALKLLHTPSQASDVELERFLREFKILSQLSNENIVTFYSAALSPEGFPYAVFELLRGRDLHRTISQDGKLPYKRTLRIAEQICLAMDYAHARGIIHRDLKPENIMLLQKPEADWVKVLDFGFARETAPTTNTKQKLTATGMVVGTVCYMSPEQCKGGKAEIPADIYALACIIYECLAGKLLFEADSPMGVVHKQIYEDPQGSLKLLHGSVPDGLIPVLAKALDKYPQRRHRSMAELRNDLLALPIELIRKPKFAASKIAKISLLCFLSIALLLGGLAALKSYISTKHRASDTLLKRPSSHTAKLLSVQSTTTMLFDADTAIAQHEYLEAEKLVKLAREKARREHDLNSIFQSNLSLTRIALLCGDKLNAKTRAERGVADAKKYFGLKSVHYARALKLLGDTYENIEPRAAEKIYQQLIDESAEANQKPHLEFVTLLSSYVRLCQKEGDSKTSELILQKYKSRFDSADVHSEVRIRFLCLEASVEYALGHQAAGDRITTEGLKLTDFATDLRPHERANLHVTWSSMLFGAGNSQRALKEIRLAQENFKSVEQINLLAELYLTEADMLVKSGEAEKAIEPLDKAITLLTPRTLPKPMVLLSEIYFARATCYLKLDQFDKALKSVDEAIRICPADTTLILTRCSDLRKSIEAQIASRKTH